MGNFSDLPDFGDAQATDEIAVVRGGRTGRAHPAAGTSLSDAQIGDKAFSNPPSDLSDAEKTAVLAAIGAGTPLIDNEFDGTTGAGQAEARIAGIAIANSANVAYLIRVGAATEYVLGSALYASRSGSPVQIGIANFYSKTGGGAGMLYRTLDEATDAPLEIWRVNDLAAIRSVVGAAGKTDAQIGDAAFSNPPSDLTDDEKTAAREAIGAGTGEGGADPLFESLLDGTLGSSNAEVDLGVTIENDANVAYLVQVGDHERYILGDALYAARSATPVSLGPVHFYSKAGTDAGKLYQDIQTSWVASTVLRIWKLNDISGLQSMLSAVDPDQVDELRADLAKLHTYIAEHVTDISSEVVDPTQADSPAHYYLTERARHTVNGVSIPFETGLYELTTGTANRFKCKMEKVGNWWGVNTREYNGTPNRGEILHNPLSMLLAWWVEQDSGGVHWMHAIMKGRVYDLLRTRYNLANTAIFFVATDGSSTHWFEMGVFDADVQIAGVQYYAMRLHLEGDTALRDAFLGWFTDGNENAPTLDVRFNQSFQQAGRADSPVGYTIGGSGTTKAYTFRENGFAVVTGAGDRFIESDEIDRQVVLAQAQYDALTTKDARTIYNIVG